MFQMVGEAITLVKFLRVAYIGPQNNMQPVVLRMVIVYGRIKCLLAEISGHDKKRESERTHLEPAPY